MKPKSSRTINRLHFEDLSPNRFEDLCMVLVHQLHPWIEIRHYGRSGSDGGVDIFAKERLEDGLLRNWSVQCRRYAKATSATLKKAVDDVMGSKSSPDVLLVIVSCDVSRSAHESFEKYAAKKGANTPLLWTASYLEAKLFNERKDLLFTYFGISEHEKARARDASISRNIALKKRLRKDLLADPKDIDWEKARKSPPMKFQSSEIIVHSIDDDSYPEIEPDSPGISGWFKLEIWDFYHNGLEFIVRVERGVVDKQTGQWAIIEHTQKYDQSRFREIRMYKIARIPFRNIVEYDIAGDEYYSFPHLYCRFADGGEPYENFRYTMISDDFPWPMNPKLQISMTPKSGR